MPNLSNEGPLWSNHDQPNTSSPDTKTPTATGLTTRAPPKIQMKDNHGELLFVLPAFFKVLPIPGVLFFSQLIFIGPESDHCLLLSVTH